MQHINYNLATIRRRIMLRVWYSYFISLIISGGFLYGFLLGGAVAVFGRLTHVAAIFHNLQLVPVASLPGYVWHTIVTALSGGEFLTVLVTISILTLTLGAVTKLVQILERDLVVV